MNYCGRCRQKYDNHGRGHADNCPLGAKYKELLKQSAEKIKAQPKNDEPELIFIKHSIYPGYCRSKDCRSEWQAGDSIYWNPKTREVYCENCGDLLND